MMKTMMKKKENMHRECLVLVILDATHGLLLKNFRLVGHHLRTMKHQEFLVLTLKSIDFHQLILVIDQSQRL